MKKQNAGRPQKNKDRVFYDLDLTREEDRTVKRLINEHPTTGRALMTKLVRDWMNAKLIAS